MSSLIAVQGLVILSLFAGITSADEYKYLTVCQEIELPMHEVNKNIIGMIETDGNMGIVFSDFKYIYTFSDGQQWLLRPGLGLNKGEVLYYVNKYRNNYVIETNRLKYINTNGAIINYDSNVIRSYISNKSQVDLIRNNSANFLVIRNGDDKKGTIRLPTYDNDKYGLYYADSLAGYSGENFVLSVRYASDVLVVPIEKLIMTKFKASFPNSVFIAQRNKSLFSTNYGMGIPLACAIDSMFCDESGIYITSSDGKSIYLLKYGTNGNEIQRWVIATSNKSAFRSGQFAMVARGLYIDKSNNRAYFLISFPDEDIIVSVEGLNE